jgi:hypothetical protein
MGEFKDEGLIGIVNLIGDYNYVDMDKLEGDDVMKMMQVCQGRRRLKAGLSKGGVGRCSTAARSLSAETLNPIPGWGGAQQAFHVRRGDGDMVADHWQ